MNQREMLTIRGEIDYFRFKDENTRFCVALLLTVDEEIFVIGDLVEADDGDEIECIGYYTENEHGRQFRCEHWDRILPSTVEAIRRYLASGIIKGIGPAKAKAIVERFGEETFDVIENSPELLAEVPGIRHASAMEYAEQFKKQHAVKGLSVFFMKYNLPVASAVTACRRWGAGAEELIKADPYMLCGEGLRVSFEKADVIGRTLGIPQDSPLRIRGGIVETIHKEMNESKHTCLPAEQLARAVCGLLKIPRETYDKALEQLIESEDVFFYDKPNGRFIMQRDIFRAESYIAKRLSLMGELSFDNKIDFSEVIDKVQENGIVYDEKQRRAINLSLSCGFLVITGGPGTGKTTTLNAIIKLFKQQTLNVMIAAPTGRAAKRISELTGCTAKTIHRLLEVKRSDDEKLSFIHDEKNKLECDVLIIDEMSMVDTLLFEAVLRAVSMNCKLVLVGDSDQLPSVGAGNVLGDIIGSGAMPVVRLEKVFRQAEQSRIITNAYRIVNGELIDLHDKSTDDFYFMKRTDAAGLRELVSDLCSKRLPEHYGCSAFDDIQVISPARVGDGGVETLNAELQQAMNPKAPDKPEITVFGTTFRKGDKVMQKKNDYDIVWKRVGEGEEEDGAGIFNGDIGRIISCNSLSKTLTIDFDGRIAEYTRDMLENLELAYAITVHKSQGSEYNIVVLTVLGVFGKLKYRNMLYTAVTRAKRLLVIVGDNVCVNEMIMNRNAPVRYTCLREMLEERTRDEEEAAPTL